MWLSNAFTTVRIDQLMNGRESQTQRKSHLILEIGKKSKKAHCDANNPPKSRLDKTVFTSPRFPGSKPVSIDTERLLGKL